MNSTNKTNLTVVHSNDLVEASYSLSLDEMRLINLGLTKIDSRKPNPGDINIYPEEFSEMFSIENNVWRCMKLAVDKIMTNPVSIIKADSKGRLKKTNLSWLTKSVYSMDENDGTRITIRFSEEITPYLFELKDRFTAINFEYASRLTTPFSYRLYSWLMEAKHLNKAKQGCAITIELEIDWIKERAGLVGSYERWDKFKDKVIQPAVDNINTKTDISVIWKPIRQGNATKSITFSYVIEESQFTKPTRPRLFRRPKVTAGSHAEGEWMRKNLRLLMAYEVELNKYDPKAIIDMADLRKMVNYADKTGQSPTHLRLKKELNTRRNTGLRPSKN